MNPDNAADYPEDFRKAEEAKLLREIEEERQRETLPYPEGNEPSNPPPDVKVQELEAERISCAWCGGWAVNDEGRKVVYRYGRLPTTKMFCGWNCHNSYHS